MEVLGPSPTPALQMDAYRRIFGTASREREENHPSLESTVRQTLSPSSSSQLEQPEVHEANSPPEVEQNSDESSSEDESVSFTTSGLPPSLQRIATSPEWLRFHFSSRRRGTSTGAQLLQDFELFPGPSFRPPPPTSAEDLKEGRLLRCGPATSLPSNSSLATHSSCYPNPLLSTSSSGCSTILLPPSYPIELVDFDFLLVKKTGTSVQHAHLHERGWTVALPFEKYSKLSLVSGDGDDFRRPFGRETSAVDSDEEEEDERVMGCGCKTREVQCFGCGNVVGFQLVKGCPRHDVWSRGFTVVVFYPPSVYLSYPPVSSSLITTSKKRKRSNSITKNLAQSYSQLMVEHNPIFSLVHEDAASGLDTVDREARSRSPEVFELDARDDFGFSI